VQVSKDLSELHVDGELVTHGGVGISLVKGVQTPLRAMALSIQSGGRIGSVKIGGSLVTRGDGVVTLEVLGELDEIEVSGEVAAFGNGSNAIETADEVPGLAKLSVQAKDGNAVVRVGTC
jgi:hypothetical protein